MTTLVPPVAAEARLRRKNQITLPEQIASALDARPDDILVFETNPEDPHMACVRVLPRSFAGSMTGLYGTTEQMLGYLREEHAAWEEGSVE
jgi:bifunctional DNA-binding transcriptional regulator/antitoxin component of YhaV-PrlF toxin-antitoxin module